MTGTMTMQRRAVGEPLLSRRLHWNNQVRRHALVRPGHTALELGGDARTWAELDRNARLFAGALEDLGVVSGDRVVMLMMNRLEFVESLLAINSIGAIAVPVNVRTAPPELTYLVEDSGATAIVTDTDLVGVVSASGVAEARSVPVVVSGGGDRGYRSYDDMLALGRDGQVVDVTEDAPALIMYTSGTTGRPKGAVLTHSNLQAQCAGSLDSLGCRKGDVLACAVPLFHIGGIASLVVQLFLGEKTSIFPLGGFDPDVTLDELQRVGATWTFLVPAQWQVVSAAQLAEPRDLSLRMACWGAAPASDTILEAMAEAFPDADSVAVFGQTETTGFAYTLDGADARRKIGSVGKPIASIWSRIVDVEMNDVAAGEVGEVVYRGPTVMQGYWGRPEATEEAFRGGWFHSGDLVRQDDEGFLYVVDRVKDMIISGGENIYCAEVENAMAKHPAIAEATLIGRGDERWGEVPVAVVALTPGSELSLEELQTFLGQHLARFKQPKELVVIDALPRNASGKVVKPSLRESYGSKDGGLHA